MATFTGSFLTSADIGQVEEQVKATELIYAHEVYCKHGSGSGFAMATDVELAQARLTIEEVSSYFGDLLPDLLLVRKYYQAINILGRHKEGLIKLFLGDKDDLQKIVDRAVNQLGSQRIWAITVMLPTACDGEDLSGWV